ncbi:MAG: OmpA family protein [Croceitalea sp.]|nr:OmpA family protein [Croceitalea sp.]
MNPSFEEFKECPNSLGTFGIHVTHWSTPTKGTTDYFNTCSTVMGAPENFKGLQHVKFGSAYAGLYFYAPTDYREYIQVPLRSTLKKGNTYILSFHISLAEGSDFAVKDFGVVLSQKPYDIPTKANLSKGRLFKMSGNLFQSFEINNAQYHKNKTDWLEVKTTVVAKGFERFLILGNLRNNASTRKLKAKRQESKRGSYYYIDMVSLTNRDKSETPKPQIENDSLYVFKNLHFDFDRFTLTKVAKAELAKVQQKLLDNPNLKLEIHGHTDNFGKPSYNKILSEKRAKTIANYFIEVGIVRKRITWYGHGSTKPVADNNSEQGRALNRRAEFILKTQ